MYRHLSVLAASAMLAACASSPKAVPMQEFRCADGTVLSISFADESATVMMPDGAIVSLPQQRAASGIWYSSGRHELRGKGNELDWTVGRRAPVSCTAAAAS